MKLRARDAATLPFVTELADHGIERALSANAHLRNGLSVFRGAITQAEVAAALGYQHVDPIRALTR